jgi:hypothetical protein
MCINPDMFADAAGSFSRAADNTTHTPETQRQRDLAEYLTFLVPAAGMSGTEEHRAFTAQQATLGDQISREADPEKRAELRTEREAQGNEYASKLSAGLALVLEASGQYDDAKDMRLAAETRAEIAAELRQPSTEPPEHDRAAQIRADFARDAAAVGREIGLGPTAETVYVAEMEEPWRPEASLTRGVVMGMAPGGGAVLQEVVQSQPDKIIVENGPTEAEAAHDALLTRLGDESSKRQEAEDAALRGGGDQHTKAASVLAELDAFVKDATEKHAETPAPENEQGQEASHAAAFRSFGR